MPLYSHRFLNYSIPNLNHSSRSPDIYCYMSQPNSLIFIPFCFINMCILLPLCIIILHRGLLQWRQNLLSPATAVVKHSDLFTYHMASLELIGVLGCFLSLVGFYRNCLIVLKVGVFFYCFTCFGETFFHILTCVEHYLAVVRPITYLSLRKRRGIRIRNITIGCSWLLSIIGSCILATNNAVIIINITISTLTISIVSFCSLSVLYTLIHPGPGTQGRVDKSKKRAFYNTVVILGVFLLRFIWGLVWVIEFIMTGKNACLISLSNVWFNLPSSLVLPSLFLHRTATCVFPYSK